MANFIDNSPIMKGTEAAKAADYANYFSAYSYLYHQKQMLMDNVRMQAYHGAIMANKKFFEGKTVLDVGTGSGVLAIWCAQAGAKKVYACEFTNMAKHARAMVESNGLSDIVEVIQSSAEELNLPCGEGGVDVIISEWMGYMLLRESMLDSVLRARNKWLNPSTGVMFPSHATMYWGAISFEEDRHHKMNEYANSMADWHDFAKSMKSNYNIKVDCLTETYDKEQADYFIHSALWTELSSEHLVGQSIVMKTLDLNTCTLEDAEAVDRMRYSMNVPIPTRVSGFAGWFTTDFAGSNTNPATKRVILSTGPEVGYTHWGQQVFYLRDAIECPGNTSLSGNLSMVRQEVNKRLYDMHFSVAVNNGDEKEYKYEIP
jgi:type I protein arginine methyltransferase